MVVFTEDDKKAGMRKETTNRISESRHAQSTLGLKTSGTVQIDYVTGKGQYHSNDDNVHDHRTLITGRSQKTSPKKASMSLHEDRCLRSLNKLLLGLKQLLIQASMEGTTSTKKQFHKALAQQQALQWKRRKLAMAKKLEATKNAYIDGIYIFVMYNSQLFWDTNEKAQYD